MVVKPLKTDPLACFVWLFQIFERWPGCKIIKQNRKYTRGVWVLVILVLCIASIPNQAAHPENPKRGGAKSVIFPYRLGGGVLGRCSSRMWHIQNMIFSIFTIRALHALGHVFESHMLQSSPTRQFFLNFSLWVWVAYSTPF